MFENLLTQVMIRMEDAGAIKQKIFHHFHGVARRCGADILDGKQVSFWRSAGVCARQPARLWPAEERARHEPHPRCVHRRRGDRPRLFRFYRSIGINLKQLYGQTETCAYVCLQPDGQIKLDSVGMPAPGVEVKIADNGEILVKGRCCSRNTTSARMPRPNRSTPMATS